MTNITAAIKTASNNHSQLFRFGSGWKYSRTEGRNWRESDSRDYAQAREARCISIAEDALAAMGYTDTYCWLQDATGSATQRVRAYLASRA